jgi:hypothetical protein
MDDKLLKNNTETLQVRKIDKKQERHCCKANTGAVHALRSQGIHTCANIAKIISARFSVTTGWCVCTAIEKVARVHSTRVGVVAETIVRSVHAYGANGRADTL